MADTAPPVRLGGCIVLHTRACLSLSHNPHSLLSKLLVFEPHARLTATEALAHPFLDDYACLEDEPRGPLLAAEDWAVSSRSTTASSSYSIVLWASWENNQSSAHTSLFSERAVRDLANEQIGAADAAAARGAALQGGARCRTAPRAQVTARASACFHADAAHSASSSDNNDHYHRRRSAAAAAAAVLRARRPVPPSHNNRSDDCYRAIGEEVGVTATGRILHQDCQAGRSCC